MKLQIKFKLEILTELGELYFMGIETIESTISSSLAGVFIRASQGNAQRDTLAASEEYHRHADEERLRLWLHW